MVRWSRGFTLIELLAVIAIIALLIGVLLPALGAARLSARSAVCTSNTRQLVVAANLYLDDFDRRLPQITIPDPFGGGEIVVGSLFGGKLGSLPVPEPFDFGINSVGASRRPLNGYVLANVPARDTRVVGGSEIAVEAEPFRSPLDSGGELDLGGGSPYFTDSLYDTLGSSYAINDHAPTGSPSEEETATLIPQGGGRMPSVFDPTRTVLIGSQPIYAHDDGGDRGTYWYGQDDRRPGNVLASVGFVDGHAEGGVAIGWRPDGPVWATRDYTFVPSPGLLPEGFGLE